MAKIQVLSPHTAELIAAGEVVERPASVVKELAENAVDAGARHIAVSIERGGVSLIQVSDDGSGIEAEYLPTAFLRHATSKIRTEDDLENITTLGFRGEALPSIAGVARVEVLTKTPQDEFACLYRIEGGRELGMEAGARPVGTTFTVRDLFYNVPARMKFLKKDQSEGNYVTDVMTHMALSHPEIAFKFVREGRLQFQTPGDGDLRSAASAVLNRDFARELLETEHTQGGYRVTGLVTPPKNCRASRAMQFFFINGRFVKNRTMMAALEAAYKGTLMQGKFPGGVLMLRMPAQLVDVNVHPAKTEVRFAREKEVFDTVYAAVKAALSAPGSLEEPFSFSGSGQQVPPPVHPVQVTDPFAVRRAPSPQPRQADVKPVATVLPDIAEDYGFWRDKVKPMPIPDAGSGPVYLATAAKAPYVPPASAHTPITPEMKARARAAQRRMQGLDVEPDSGEEALPSVPVKAKAQAGPAENEPPVQPVQTVLPGAVPLEENLRFVGEVFGTYIIAQRGKELCFIDKHAAHERILYEKLAENYGRVDSQLLMQPVVVQLSADEKNALLAAKELLADSGIELDDFGAGTVAVRSVPADVVPADVEDLVVDVAGRLLADPRQTVSEKTEWVLHSIACRAAVKAGDKTHPTRLLQLAQAVLDGKIPPFCPHGRPVALRVTLKELEKQFGRQG